MKNKKIMFLLFAVLILTIMGLLYYKINQQKYKVDKLSLCSVVTYDLKKIADYNNNNQAFKIVSLNENLKIKINGKKYDKEGIYKPGKYTIEVENGEKKEIATINICKLEEKERNEYDIYCINATYPLFLASMDIVKNKDNEGFLWFSRYGTLDLEKIKELNPKLTFSKYLNEDTSKKDLNRVNEEVKEYVSNILEKDKKAYFKLYIDDFLYWYEYPIFEELGISEDKYEVIMYSDGTLSYTAKYGITKDNSYDFYKQEQERYNKVLKEVRSGKYNKNINSLSYLLPSEGGDKTENLLSEYDSNFILLATLRENVTYYMQYPELITYKDKKVERKMKKSNIKELSAIEKYRNLSEEMKNKLNEILYLDKKEMDMKYFNDSKPKLVITGSNPFYEEYTKDEFENILEKVCNEYGEEYKLLYKPHPKAEPNEEQLTILNKFNIKVLPAKLPMEAIMFVYDDIKLGGFPSTLYMSTDSDNTLFFFEENKEDLVEPLNILYDKLFIKANFIIPKND